jgi:hypothetical protein
MKNPGRGGSQEVCLRGEIVGFSIAWAPLFWDRYFYKETRKGGSQEVCLRGEIVGFSMAWAPLFWDGFFYKESRKGRKPGFFVEGTGGVSRSWRSFLGVITSQ